MGHPDPLVRGTDIIIIILAKNFNFKTELKIVCQLVSYKKKNEIASLKSLKKGVGSKVESVVGSESISQMNGSGDPDPHQNVTDTLIKMIMQQICIRRTEDCLKQNMEKLDQLAELLLKKETLNYQDVEDLLGP